MGWPRVKAKAVWASEWKSQKRLRAGAGRGEHAKQRIRGNSHSDLVRRVLWDFGEGELGGGRGYILWHSKSSKLTVTSPSPVCIAAQWERMHYIRR